jgi:tetratricopeptide (TPR) repeat protein
MGTVIEALNKVKEFTLVGGDDLTDKNKIKENFLALNTLLKKYPEESYLYIVKTKLASEEEGNTNYSEMNSDLNTAAKYAQQNDKGVISAGKYKVAVFNSTIDLLRARISILSGDKKEVDHLMDSVKETLRETRGDTNLSIYFILFNGAGGEKTELTPYYFDSLVQSYPSDFRVYILRGIFYGGNIGMVGSSKNYFTLALNDFNKAIKLNPKSADAYYFMGKLYSEKVGQDVSKNGKLSTKYLNQAISLDPNYTYAYLTLGVDNFLLGNYEESIKNFGKVIELDPDNIIAYYFRSAEADFLNKFDPYGNQTLTEDILAQERGAIADITKLIQLQEGSPFYAFYRYDLLKLYGIRAGYYFKIRDRVNAVKDFDKVIGFVLAKQIYMMDIKTIRSIYPEFADISDENLIEGLRQKYYPLLYEKKGFHDLIMSNKNDTRAVRSVVGEEDYMNKYILSYYYLQRGEAYYESGDPYNASIEYKRMAHNSPEYPVDKVRLLRMSSGQ